MKHRNPFLVVIFSLITGGIYYLYWLASTRKVLNQETQKKVPTVWLMIAPYVLAIVIAPIILIVSIASANNTVNSLQNSEFGAPSTSVSHASLVLLVIEVIAILVIVPITFYWVYKYSKAVDEYTNKEMSTVLSFILLWILSYIGAAIIQDKFNDKVPGAAATANAGNNNNFVNPGTSQSAPPTQGPSQVPQPISNPIAPPVTQGVTATPIAPTTTPSFESNPALSVDANQPASTIPDTNTSVETPVSLPEAPRAPEQTEATDTPPSQDQNPPTNDTV